MRKKKVVFEVVIDEALAYSGVNAISLVDSPAIDSNFIALKKALKPLKLKAVDTEKHLLMGAVLIPNKPIYRNVEGDEFYIIFSGQQTRNSSRCCQI